MPDNRHAAACPWAADAVGKLAVGTIGAGGKAGIDNGGTVGECASWVANIRFAQCAGHSAGSCWPCAIGMPSQCAGMPTLIIRMSSGEQTYEAKATCWNSSDKTASTASHRRVRFAGRKYRLIARAL